MDNSTSTTRDRRLGIRVVRQNVATRNRAGGLAYRFTDPAMQLIATAGAIWGEEPAYYDPGPEGSSNDSADDAWGGARGSTRRLNIMAAARRVARGRNPRDLLAIAAWVRRELGLCRLPLVLLAVAAAEPRTKPWVRRYCPQILRRPDDLRGAFEVALDLFGRPLPSSLKRGLADAFRQFDEAALLDYDTARRPTFGDVLRMIDRGRDRAVPQALHAYLVDQRMPAPHATPVLAARKALALHRVFDASARDLARAGRVRWEVLLSQFGNQRDVWAFILAEGGLGYLALIRNLANLAAHDLDDELVERIALRIRSEATNGHCLPTQLLSALRAISPVGPCSASIAFLQLRFQRMCNPRTVACWREALAAALDRMADAAPRLFGRTLIAVDGSGSMTQPLGRRSRVTIGDAAQLLAALLVRQCDPAQVWVFAGGLREVAAPPESGVWATMKVLRRTRPSGMGSNAHLIPRRLTEDRQVMDRVIVITDGQAWDSNPFTRYDFAPAFLTYRETVARDVWLHAVDVAGYGDALIDPATPRVNLVAGLSDRVLRQIHIAEQGGSGHVPTALLAHVRGRY